MMRRVEVRCRVLARGAVTAADVPARQTQSELHPFAALGQAFLAAVRRAGFRILNLVQMGTCWSHGSLLQSCALLRHLGPGPEPRKRLRLLAARAQSLGPRVARSHRIGNFWVAYRPQPS